MGMFDSFYFEDESILNLPEDLKGYKHEFQCKDLDCILNCYKVDKKGQLWRDKIEGYYVKPEKINKKSFNFPTFVETSTIRIDETLTQTLNIYTSNHNDSPGANDYWIDLQVQFINGILTKSNIIELKYTSNKDRLEHEEKIFRQMDEATKFRKSFKGKIYIYLVEKPVGLIRRLLRKFINLLNNFESYLIRF